MPGAGGDGPTAEEAVRAAQESVHEFIELKKQYGDPIPPSDIAEPEFSGQIRLRMPKSLHRELAAEAEREAVSLNHIMVMYLTTQVRTQGWTAHAPVSSANRGFVTALGALGNVGRLAIQFGGEWLAGTQLLTYATGVEHITGIANVGAQVHYAPPAPANEPIEVGIEPAQAAGGQA